MSRGYTRNEARDRLRFLLGPFREYAVEVFEFADIQDGIRLRGNYFEQDDQELYALAETAGWDIFLPLEEVFREAAE